MAKNLARAAQRAERAERERLAAEAERRRHRRATLTRGALIAVVLVLVLAAGAYFGHRGGDTVDTSKVAAAGQSSYGLAIGPDSATHQVVIYEDFLCPFCAQLESATHGQLATLAQAGGVQVDYRPFDLLGGGDDGSYSARSTAAFAVVLERSGPEVAKRFHDLLYAQQPDESGPFPSDADLLQLAVEAGAVPEDVASAIDGGAGLDWVTSATKEASAAHVMGTPTVLLDGKVLDNDNLATQLLGAVGPD